jgi:hypothetical protein
MAVDEVRILGDDHSLFAIQEIEEFLVSRPVLVS